MRRYQVTDRQADGRTDMTSTKGNLFYFVKRGIIMCTEIMALESFLWKAWKYNKCKK
jgi:hypothetical protein